MDLKELLVKEFMSWMPKPPEVLRTSHHHVELCWLQEDQPFGFLNDVLMYRLQKKAKIPEWITIYSGGKTCKSIDNLAAANPHKFRVQIILKDVGIPQLLKRALQFYGGEKNIINTLLSDQLKEVKNYEHEVHDNGDERKNEIITRKLHNGLKEEVHFNDSINKRLSPRWLESMWSEEICTSTESDGTSAICFCMAVKCGYLNQVQTMLDERAGLIAIINSTNGLTPLATAVRKGDMNMVRFLISAGADMEQTSSAGQRALHQAVYFGYTDIADYLIEKGADFHARDINGLRVEHYAVDSGALSAVVFVFERGGDLHVTDGKGWTPLFRAVIQGADSSIVEELINRGSLIDIEDVGGITLSAAAKLLKGRGDRILRLVDTQYSHQKAVANFTRITKKISSVQSFFK